MDVAILEKILRRAELRSLFDVDSTGKGPLDYAEPGSEGKLQFKFCGVTILVLFLAPAFAPSSSPLSV